MGFFKKDKVKSKISFVALTVEQKKHMISRMMLWMYMKNCLNNRNLFGSFEMALDFYERSLCTEAELKTLYEEYYIPGKYRLQPQYTPKNVPRHHVLFARKYISWQEDNGRLYFDFEKESDWHGYSMNSLGRTMGDKEVERVLHFIFYSHILYLRRVMEMIDEVCEYKDKRYYVPEGLTEDAFWNKVCDMAVDLLIRQNHISAYLIIMYGYETLSALTKYEEENDYQEQGNIKKLLLSYYKLVNDLINAPYKSVLLTTLGCPVDLNENADIMYLPEEDLKFEDNVVNDLIRKAKDLQTDLDAGRINRETYDDLVKKLEQEKFDWIIYKNG